jgi:hypothetical protein
MSPNVWGPPVWNFFHTLTYKIKEETFSSIFPPLFEQIRLICKNLPCPDCSMHATKFLNRVNLAGIKTKQDFINLFFFFHNAVNKRKQKPLFKYENLSQYENKNPIVAFNEFLRVFHTKGNMRLLAESFQRQLVLKNFRQWFLNNIQHFM